MFNQRRFSQPCDFCRCLWFGVIALVIGSSALAATFTNLQVLWSFSPTDNIRFPVSALLEASDGALYGPTYGHFDDFDVGAVFKINKDGTAFSIVHRFLPEEGGATSGALIEATNGVLYGNNFANGSAARGSNFRVNKDGSGFVVTHQFTSVTNGTSPQAGLLFASDGLLYGTTSSDGLYKRGVIFRMDLNGGNFLILRHLNTNDGRFPSAALIEGTNGALYGLGSSGGVSNGGTIFKMDKDGSNFSVVHDFIASDGGSAPRDSLMKGPNGKLYGGTGYGGTFGVGTIFSVDHNGSNYTVLHHFGGVAGDGGGGNALVQGPDGALYGTTPGGGNKLPGQEQMGTIFRVNPDGTGYEVLIRFTGTNGPSPGRSPLAGLVAGTDGALYGTCGTGGTFNRGTVFKLAPDQNRLSVPQRVGATVWRISGRGMPLGTYMLQYSPDFNSTSGWSNLTTVAADAQGNWQFNDPTNSAQRFYRTTVP